MRCAAETLVIKGEAKHWEPGQSVRAGGETRFIGDSTFTVHADIANRVIRVDWDRDMKYVVVERLQFSEIVYPDLGVVIDAQGTRPMSGIRLASHHREYGRGSPFLLLRALDDPQGVSAIEDQRLGEQSLSGGRVHAGNDALHRPVRPHAQAAGGGAHAR